MYLVQIQRDDKEDPAREARQEKIGGILLRIHRGYKGNPAREARREDLWGI